MSLRTFLSLALALGVVACDSSDPEADAGDVVDAGRDAGPDRDGGSPHDGGDDMDGGGDAGPTDTDPPTPNGTPTVTAGDDGSDIAFTVPTDADYAGAAVVRALGTTRPTTLPAAGSPLTVGDDVAGAEVVAILDAATTEWTDTVAEGDVCWSLFGFDAAYNYADLGGGCLTDVDLTAPAALADFMAEAGGEWAELTWTAPTEMDLDRVRVVVREGVDPAGPSDGTEVCDPCASPVTELGQTPGVARHYAAYVYDTAGNVSPAALDVATPGPVARDFAPVGDIPDGELFAAFTTPDGTEWAAGADVILRRPVGGVWEVHHTLDGTIVDLWGASGDDVWAIGYGTDRMLHWDGASWTSVTPPGLILNALWGTASDDVWLVGFSHGLWRWDGATWTEFGPADSLPPGFSNPQPNLSAVYARGSDDVHVSAPRQLMHWDGTDWTVTDTGTQLIGCIWGATADDVWASGSGVGGYHFDGTSWTYDATVARCSYASMRGVSASSVRTVGGHDVGHFDGSSWTSADHGQGVVTNDIAPGASSSEWYIVGRAGSIFRQVGDGPWRRETGRVTNTFFDIGGSPDGGFVVAGSTTGVVAEFGPGGFVPVLSGASGETYEAVQVFAADSAVAVGRTSRLAEWDGTEWTERSLSSSIGSRSLSSVWGVSASDVWVSSGNRLYHITGAGVATTSLSVFSIAALHGFAADDIWAVGRLDSTGTAGALFHYDGATWTPVSGDFCGALNDLHGVRPDDLWAVGAGGCALHYDGTSWSELDPGTSGALQGVHAADRFNVYLVGDGLIRWDGASFGALSVAEPPSAITAVWAADASRVFLGGSLGWTNVGVP